MGPFLHHRQQSAGWRGPLPPLNKPGGPQLPLSLRAALVQLCVHVCKGHTQTLTRDRFIPSVTSLTLESVHRNDRQTVCNRNGKEFYLSCTEEDSPTVSRVTPRNGSGEAWFSAQFFFFILSEQRASNKSEVHSFKVLKEKQKQNRESVWPWHLGRESYHGRNTSIGIPGGEAFNLYF